MKNRYMLDEKINKLMRDKELNAEQLSRETGISVSSIKNYMNGVTRKAKPVMVTKLANFFEVPESYFDEEVEV